MYQKAIIIAFKYNTISLSGTQTDITNMYDFFIYKRYFNKKDITIITDLDLTNTEQAECIQKIKDNTTYKKTIIKILSKTIKLVPKHLNSEVWFYFSGHGFNVKFSQDCNIDLTQTNKHQQYLCPPDSISYLNGKIKLDLDKVITAKHINQIFKKILLLLNFYVIIDACYSTLPLNLKYYWSNREYVCKDNINSKCKMAFVISSCQAHQKSIDIFYSILNLPIYNKGSLLTYMFIKNINEQADLSYVPLQDFIVKLAKDVKDESILVDKDSCSDISLQCSVPIDNTTYLFNFSEITDKNDVNYGYIMMGVIVCTVLYRIFF